MSIIIEQAKTQNNSISIFKETAINLFNSEDENSDKALCIALDTLEEIMDEKDFISFCDEVYSM